jgi:hypothetical protein
LKGHVYKTLKSFALCQIIFLKLIWTINDQKDPKILSNTLPLWVYDTSLIINILLHKIKSGYNNHEIE